MKLLFDKPLIDGLLYQNDIIDPAEEQALVDKLAGLDLSPFRFHGWLGNRKTKSFGWRYDFDDASFTRTEPIPDWLQSLRAKSAAFAGVEPDDFVHVLLARYDPGAGIGWHRDRPVFDRVFGLSLLSPCVLRFRRRRGAGFERFALDAQPRSAYLLTGEIRHEWEHSISPMTVPRFSITFRSRHDT